MSSYDSERSTEGDTISNEASGGQYELQLTRAIAEVLMRIIEEQKAEKTYNRRVKLQRRMPFSALVEPEISLVDYLARIVSYSKLEEATLVNALIYIDRVCQRNSIFITEYNVHRMLLISSVVSIKYNEDLYYKAEYYADIGGITKMELLDLEYEFLVLCDFDLFVEEGEYEKYKQHLSSYHTPIIKDIISEGTVDEMDY